MIAYLKGNVIFKDAEKSSIILENNGIGYEIIIPSDERGFFNILEGDSLSLFIYTYVREDRISLFGFRTSLQRDIFCLLLDVKDVGPRLAVSVLSGIEPKNFIAVVTTKDISALSGIKGIGKSKAERIIMELRNKIIKKTSLIKEIEASEVSSMLNGGFKNSASFRSGNIIEEPAPGAESSGQADNGSPLLNEGSETIFESSFALEALGYSRTESFDIAGKVFKEIKEESGVEVISVSTEELTRRCLKHIYEAKNNIK